MSLLNELLTDWKYVRDGVIAEVENLPDDKFATAPAGLPRTPLELANHIVEVARMMVGELTNPKGDFQRKGYFDLISEYAQEGDVASQLEGPTGAPHDAVQRRARVVLRDHHVPRLAPHLAMVGKVAPPRGAARRHVREALVPAAIVAEFEIGSVGPDGPEGNDVAAPEPLAPVEPAEVGDLAAQGRDRHQFELT